jgi:ribosomal protein S18 acetylase RimI-like enzyme
VTLRIEPATAELIAEVWARHWGEFMVTPERTYGPADLEGAAFYEGDDLVAFVTWLWEPGGAEITSLDSFVQGRGYGATALDHAESVIRAAGGKRARLFTTNPNIRAISMYMRRGYRVMRVHLDAMDRVRELKPAVPLEEDGLPLRDMWELEKEL